jgi:D-3-phosphoglycerate dehydrogenase
MIDIDNQVSDEIVPELEEKIGQIEGIITSRII